MRRTVLWTVPTVYFVFVSAEFAAVTHLLLTATQVGRPAFEVGVLASSLWLGILLASARAHAFVAVAGHARVFVGASFLATLAMLALPWQAQFWAWCATVGLLGVAGGLVWVTGEAWLAEVAPPERRGFFVGLFETAVGLGLMTGPALVPFARAISLPVLWLAAGLMALGALASLRLLATARVAAHAGALPGAASTAAAAGFAGAEGVALVSSAAWRPVVLPLVAVATLSGLMESGISALLPSIAMRLGFTLEAAAWLGAFIGAGSALLQPPAGHLADRYGVRRITLGAWLAVLLALAVLWAFWQQPAQVLWGVGFALGGVGGAVYTLLIVELGHRLAGVPLVKAMSVLVFAYAAGTALGPLLGGALFDLGGLRGLAGVFLGLAAVGTLAAAWALPDARRPRG